MKKTVQRTSKFKAFWGMLALVLVLGAGLFAENLAFVSHAESAAKVTSAVRQRIRPFPSRARPRERMAIPGMRYMWMRIRWDIFVPIW